MPCASLVLSLQCNYFITVLSTAAVTGSPSKCRWAVIPVFCITLCIHLTDLTTILLNFRHLLLQQTLISLVLFTVYTLKLYNLQQWISGTSNNNYNFAQTVINVIIFVIITWHWQGIFEHLGHGFKSYWRHINGRTVYIYMHMCVHVSKYTADWVFIYMHMCVHISKYTADSTLQSPLWLSQRCD